MAGFRFKTERDLESENLWVPSVVPCAVPVGEPIVDVVPGGTELEPQVKTGVGQAANTRNTCISNPHVKCTGVYCA